MPRPRRPGAPEPKRRSRKGCWPCKARKVKCGEERPSCENCKKSGETCDYSIRLNWDGRRGAGQPGFGIISFDQASQSKTESSNSEVISNSRPSSSTSSQTRPKTGVAHEWRYEPLPTTQQSSEATHHTAHRRDVSSDGSLPGLGDLDPGLVSPGIQFDPLTLGETSGEAKRMSSTFDPSDTFDHTSKRPRLETFEDDLIDPDFNWVWPDLTLSPTGPDYGSSMLPTGGTPGNGFPYHFDDHTITSPSQTHNTPSGSEYRRMSVNSLLSGPHDGNVEQPKKSVWPAGSESLHSTTYYGIDRGYRDLDLGKHDDINALIGLPPITLHNSVLSSGGHDHEEQNDAHRHSGDSKRDAGSYYSSPVFVRIPKAFEPLPAKLKENPMNILYFHHFLNHTAKVLVPHDDPQSNPFRTILPRMALQNDNLLSLLLAYSASHRARLLGHPAPAARIALWVQDIFPALRHALADPEIRISDANVATAVMLASLEIICPTAFGYTIPWQSHLRLARDLIAARPEGLTAPRHSSFILGAGGGSGTEVCSFLWSWFAYLDVLGGLSGGLGDASPSWILDYKVYAAEDDDEIDCIMGFSTGCIYILAKVGELAKRCDKEKMELLKGWEDERAQFKSERPSNDGGLTDNGDVEPSWTPSPSIITLAKELEHEIRGSMAIKTRPCAHIMHSADLNRWDNDEMTATNEAYHWSALITVHRRILAKPRDHPDVQVPVKKIGECLQRVSRGGGAEGCLLSPMFTAGCEAMDEEMKTEMKERMGNVEASGMSQAGKVRRLMERVWETGLPMERLMTSEFVG